MIELFKFGQKMSINSHLSMDSNQNAHRALLSRGTYVRMARSPVVQTEIETRARSTLGNVLTGKIQFSTICPSKNEPFLCPGLSHDVNAQWECRTAPGF